MPRAIRALVIVWAASLPLCTIARAARWTDERALWVEATERSPQLPRAWINLGRYDQIHRAPAAARWAYVQALARTARHTRSLDEQMTGHAIALANLALLEQDAERDALAWVFVRQAHRTAPRLRARDELN